MTAHTPGPWEVIIPEEPYGGIEVYAMDAKREVVVLWQDDAPVPDFNAKQWANARLIAAAPELLEALQYALSMWGDYLPPANSNAMKAIKRARAAISDATARGES